MKKIDISTEIGTWVVWALAYQIEAEHEPNGISGGIASAEPVGDDKVKVRVDWGDEDTPSKGGPVKDEEYTYDYVISYPGEKQVKDANETAGTSFTLVDFKFWIGRPDHEVIKEIEDDVGPERYAETLAEIDRDLDNA